MCGIAGLILDEPDPSGPAWLVRMTQLLHHRGPDDGGAVVFGPLGTPVVTRVLGDRDEAVSWGHVPTRVGLGARRLAVMDLSPAGRQPMSSPDGRVWIVFNGEIYNHGALRRELSARGVTFNGNSDTEVLLAAYRVWGSECFERLEGMWALAVMDWGSRRVVLSRDRFGIKPLYYARFGGGVAFASEIKALLALPGLNRDVNEERLRDFLSEGLVDHTDETLYENVWSIPPGCWVELDVSVRSALDVSGSIRRYWRPRFGFEDDADAVFNVRSRLFASVESHLESDVAVGSCLSGGLDSSAVVSIAHSMRTAGGDRASNWSQHTFTAGLPGSPLDETRYAESVVDSCDGLQWHVTQPTADGLLDDITSLMWHQEQPFGSPSIYMQWAVMRLARATGVTVLLDGQGGDELFCGYQGYLPPYLAHLLSRGRILSFVREFRFGRSCGFGTTGLTGHVFARMLPRALLDRLRRRVNARRQPWLARELFSPSSSPTMFDTLHLRPAERVAGAWHTPALSCYLWSILLSESLPSLLRFEDRNSMAFSIEARVPLLDRRLVELAMRLPVQRKIADGRFKTVLREALRGTVPAGVLDRQDKIGFSAPTADWMLGPLRGWWEGLLSSQAFRERGCFEQAGVEKAVKRFTTGDTGLALPIWRMAIVEQWATQFLDGGTED
ncbi:MAG: asparagine synthase (glutamine-hydrolyzing) [Planctomycetota bacterium]